MAVRSSCDAAVLVLMLLQQNFCQAIKGVLSNMMKKTMIVIISSSSYSTSTLMLAIFLIIY